NLIGTDVTGTKALRNGGDGILISFTAGTTNPSSLGNTIGGTTAAARNIISGNQTDGVEIYAPNGGGSGNLILGNFIGTDITGATALGNVSNGISINEASNNTVGGTGNAANTIGFNSDDGIEITGSGATANVVLGNYIGTNASADNLGNGNG